jgi:hypothetical protein
MGHGPPLLPENLISRIVASLEGQQGCVSKNLRQRSQVDRDYWNGLFDTQAGPAAGVSRLSI